MSEVRGKRLDDISSKNHSQNGCGFSKFILFAHQFLYPGGEAVGTGGEADYAVLVDMSHYLGVEILANIDHDVLRGVQMYLCGDERIAPVL